MNKTTYFLLRALVIGSFCVSSNLASMAFVTHFPNGNNVPCDSSWSTGCTNSVCLAFGHATDSSGTTQDCSSTTSGTFLNSFGIDSSNNSNVWTQALCQADSDSDGKSNGEELGDPCCVWSVGNSPRYLSGISHPGTTNSVTLGASCNFAKPDAPSGVNANTTGTTASVFWSPPIVSQSCVCGYYITAIASGEGVKTYTFNNNLNLTQTITGLTADTSYIIRVYARNFFGDSDPSSVAATTINATIPSYPRNITLLGRTKTSMNITWIAPESDGDSPITGYQIEFDDLFLSNVSATPTTAYFSGLTQGTSYDVRMKAHNDVGYSGWSARTRFSTVSSSLVNLPNVMLVLVALVATWCWMDNWNAF